jgi:hypothetical protein
MATAAAKAKKPANKSLAANPAQSTYKAPAKGTSKAPAKNTSTAVAKKPAAKKPRANPSPIISAAILAIGGALTVVAFDEAVNRIMPSLSAPFRIGAKFAVGLAIGSYGSKIPVIGKFLGPWARVIQGALWFSAAYDGFNAYIRPMLGGWLTPLGGVQITSQESVRDPATGQMGMRFRLADGNSFDVFNGNAVNNSAMFA